VGPAYGECTLDSFAATSERQRRVVAALREYAADCVDLIGQRTGLVFFGPVGTGKDHLAFAVCREAIAAGRSVTWINGQSWFGELRDNMDRGQPEKMAVSVLCRGSILTISDPLPPVGDLTQYQQTMLYRVVERRYSLGLATFVTANVADDAEAHRRLGVPTWDRLCHGAWKLHCAWPSHRKPARDIR
jgi:DNA replication protein DnaC